jgi:nicotinate-nucleotide adenylyltransferase
LKKYAIFGGSFDPPHICHEEIVRLCLQELKLDRLFVVPTFLSPFKNSFTVPPELRYDWLCKIFKKYENITVCDFEIKKQRAVYMIETASEIAELVGKQNCDKIYLIIGSDNLAGFKKWHMYDELMGLVTPVVVMRKGVSSDEYKSIELNCDFSSTEFRDSHDALMLPCEIRDEIMSFYKGKN